MQDHIYPINFCIDEDKFRPLLYSKTRSFSSLIPGLVTTYIYNDEQSYYNQYQESYYAITYKKAGWDCMRHYEIIAAGAIPFFVDLDKCPESIMTFLPKKLILEAMNLLGVYNNTIDFDLFDKEAYFKLRDQIYYETKQHCTNTAMAAYTLNILRKNTLINVDKVLFLSPDSEPDYMKSTILPGYIKLLKRENVIDYPKIDHIYKSYQNINDLYGKGITYTRIIDDNFVNRDNITESIKNNEFSCIIYSSIHRGLPFYDLVKRYYDGRIIYLCGEDEHILDCKKIDGLLFLREYLDQFLNKDYQFYSYQDYGGNDIVHINDTMWKNYSTDIKYVIGNNIKGCRGFNTLGYYKSNFDERKMTYFKPNNDLHGIYVKKRKVAFFVRHFTERGTEDAIFNYAYYNEKILNNKSYIIAFNKPLYQKYGLVIREDIFEKFNFHFKILYVEKFEDIQSLIDLYQLDFLYNIIAGWQEHFPFAYPHFSIPTLVHCVYDPRVAEHNHIKHHHNKHMVISDDINKRYGTNVPVLPHMISIGLTLKNDRELLNIPEDAIVFGRHGGMDTFDIQYVKDCIIDFAIQHKNVYFLFMNTAKFISQNNIIFLDARIDIEAKKRFINTCDAMLHGGSMGETFGISVGEFALTNKPIITCTASTGGRAHLDFLGDKAILYSNKQELHDILNTFTKHQTLYENYKQFSPTNVMNIFADMIN